MKIDNHFYIRIGLAAFFIFMSYIAVNASGFASKFWTWVIAIAVGALVWFLNEPEKDNWPGRDN